jgi:hypothetical protein
MAGCLSLWLLLFLCVSTCKPAANELAPVSALTAEQLMDPETCKACHLDHYREWSGSMHAYAAKDPIFLAMNRLGQDATHGELGDFCVRCHAPLALRLGLTHNGLNLAEVPEKYHGVTCFFCHSVDKVTGTHDNALHLAADNILRAGIADPAASDAHQSAWSKLHARNEQESASLCGSCHDIVNAHGLELERTFQEWRRSSYAKPATEGGRTCGGCHMDERRGPASNQPGAPMRSVHSHSWPGVDVALEEFPQKKEQREQVQSLLDKSVDSGLCVSSKGGTIELNVGLRNSAAGHAFPSGASQDRRLWLEIVAKRAGEIVFHTGKTAGARHSWLFRDILFDERAKETHRFWDAARIAHRVLPFPVGAQDSTQVARIFRYRGRHLPDEVSVTLHLQPIGRDVLDELVGLGYLEAEDREHIPIFTLNSATLIWRASDRQACIGIAAPQRQ